MMSWSVYRYFCMDWVGTVKLLQLLIYNNIVMKQNIRKHTVSVQLKSRPSSSCTNLVNKKFSTQKLTTQQPCETDLFLGLYKGNRFNSNQLSSSPQQQQVITYRGESMDIQNLIKLKTKSQYAAKSSKTVEELLQENMQIKSINNRLKDEIAILRGRATGSKSNSIKDIEIQYEKDIYWSNNQNTHRVQGMKQQYEKLKRQCQRLAKELAEAKMQLASSGEKQLQIYIEQLEKENKMLISYIKNPTPFENKSVATRIKSSISNTKSPNQNYVREQLDKLKQKLKQKDDKIAFLQKSLIGKDNSEHNAHCKARKLKKQNEELSAMYFQIAQELNIMNSRLEIQKIKMKSYFNEEISQIKRELSRQVNERDQKIKQLEEALKKNGQLINKSKLNTSAMTKSFINPNRPNLRKSSHDFQNFKLLIKEQDQHQFEMTQSRRYASHPHQSNQSNFNSSKSEILQKVNQPRSPRRANKKHDENCQKMRKVQFNQVQPIGQLLKFRMIGLRIQPGHVKDYFMRKDLYTEQSERSQSKRQRSFFQVIERAQKEQQKQWQDEYITMKQVARILGGAPFLLSPSQSRLLSRYLIQDHDDQFVYCSQANENKRQIVKSIIKTIIGPYKLPTEAEQKNLQQVVSKFRPNLVSTLKSYYPRGFISKNKLIEVVISIGMEPSQKDKEILVGKACLGTDNLNQLKYMDLFQP